MKRIRALNNSVSQTDSRDLPGYVREPEEVVMPIESTFLLDWLAGVATIDVWRDKTVRTWH